MPKTIYMVRTVDLKSLYIACNNKYFDGQLPADIKIEWTDRFYACAGKYYKKKTDHAIKLSIDYHKRHPDEIVPTLLHEMIHVKVGITHGPKFKKELQRLKSLGGTVHRYAKEPAKKPRWQYTCKNCGAVVKRYRRLPKTYICGKCKSAFEESPLSRLTG